MPSAHALFADGVEPVGSRLRRPRLSLGASAAEIRRTQSIGLDGWLDEQFAMPRGQSHVDWMVGRGYNVGAFVNSRAEASHSIWRAFITRPDQLRQRMTYALSQIFVISASTITVPCPSIGAGHVMDVLETHAFGRFRDLLEAVTLSPAMGAYLSMRGSQKADLATGRQPDENYAREVMQRFTIGLTTLEPDGTPRLANGAPIETYGPADVSGLARALTGWDVVSGPGIDPATEARAITPMQPIAARHETGEKRFLGTVVPAGTGARETLSIALDTLVAHPNVGPFIGRPLIQRLVCSNPSPDYVRRVAAVFADNGARVRGDLKAVLRAILTDPEARWPDTRTAGAKLTEPVLRFTQWARAFGVTSPSGAWAIGDAAAQSATDYKALVCVFLLGGNDNGNTVVPYDDATHQAYATVRGGLALPRSASRTTTSSRPGRPAIPRVRPRAGADAWGTCSPRTTRPRPSPASAPAAHRCS